MKRVIRHNIRNNLFLAAFFISLGIGHSSFGQTNTWDGSSSANWNTAANWSLNQVPTAAHDVVIPDGITGTITVNTAAVCNSFTMNGGGTANTVSINAGQSLTVTGAVTIGAGTANGDNKILAVGSGTFTCNSITLATTGNGNRYCRLSISTGIANIAGDIIMNGPANENQVTFTGAGTLNIGGSISGGDVVRVNNCVVNYEGTSVQTVAINADYQYSILNLNNSAGATLGAAINGTNVNRTINVQSGIFNNGGFAITVGNNYSFNVSNGATFNLSGTSTMVTVSGGGTKTFGATSIVDYNGTNQTVTAQAYGNLILSGSGTKTMPGGATTVAGNFTLSGSAVATPAASVAVAGATTISGTSVLTLGAANILSTTPIILDGGTFQTGATAGYNETVGTLNVNSPSTISLGTGNHTLNFSNSSSLTPWGAGATLTINGWTGTGGITGTAGKIFFGAATGTLTAAQLAKISFTGYPGTPILLATGELVPPGLPTVTFTSASQSSANESGTMTITVQLSATSASLVTIPFTITGTATGSGTDYSISSSPVTISAGNLTTTITITITNDVIYEGNETVIVTMGTPTNANQGATIVHTATITDDDAAPDTDGDGVADNIDLDDDNDGILDSDECTSFFENYGSGSDPGPTIPYTNYGWYTGGGVATNPDDGEYVRGTNPTLYDVGWNCWINRTDHTGNANGYMYIVNSNNNAGLEFYRRTISGLQGNVDVDFSAWIVNMDLITYPEPRVRPDVTFSIRTLADVVIASANTGQVTKDEAWHQYTFTFNPGANTSVQIVMVNNAPGGLGNDLAIDDIEFRQTVCDTDGDGTVNSLDQDSDNDGCPDVIEAGFTDGDLDGMLGTSPVTVDGNGLVTGSGGYTTPADGDGNGVRDYLEAGTAPSITAQPINRSICANQNTTFSVTASNANTYQWQVSTNSGGSWANVTNTGIYTGATTATLTLTNVPVGPPYNGYWYHVLVSNSSYICGGVLTSNTATLAVSPGAPTTPVTITGTTPACSNSVGNVYSIAAVANATNYNWTVPTGWTITAGQGTLSMTATAGTTGQNGNVSVRAENGCGNSAYRDLAVTVTASNTATLTSAGGTNNQTLCINTAITNITYSTTGATGATVTGLPAGVSGVWNSNVVTISGTPSESGTFNYTVTLTGGCGTVTATGTITVNLNTVTLTSAGGTNNQTLCINTAITNITYSTTGATGATVTGLPAGVSGTWNASVVTISGTPTASGTFNYTITLTGGCGTVTTTGSITVNLNTVTLTSAAGTNNQTLCINTAITNITYSTTGATGANVTGLPAGVSGVWNANVVTISGTPSATGTFNYTVTLTGGCGTVTATGTITVNLNTVTLTSAGGTNNQTLCTNSAITNITYSTSGATGATVTGLPAGVSGVWNANVVTISGSPSESGTFNYTVNLTGGCGTITASGTITVNSIQAEVTLRSNDNGCPELIESQGFNPENGVNHNSGSTKVVFRVGRLNSSVAWSFDYNISGASVYASSLNPSPGTINRLASENYIDLDFLITNIENTPLTVSLNVTSISDLNGCSNSTTVSAVVHILAMPLLGPFD
jgi:hypothetical protein